MKRFFIYAAIFMALTLTCCRSVTPDAHQEAVLVEKPYFFGKGGVDDAVVTTGRQYVSASTDVIYVDIVPKRYDAEFKDIMSKDNTPLNYTTYVTLQVIPGMSPQLIKNYGENWYADNIEAAYRNIVRQEVSRHNFVDLMSNRAVFEQIDSDIRSLLAAHVDSLSRTRPFPVRVCDVITGRARPGDKHMKEMNNTAVEAQAKITEEKRLDKEEARYAAELARANADKAYMKALGLTVDQFISLRTLEVIAEKENVTVIVDTGDNARLLNIK